MLKVIEQQQERFVVQFRFELLMRREAARFIDLQCGGDMGEHQERIMDGSERDKEDAIRKVGKELLRHCETEARFADTSWAGECQ
jgi:hypothetical protein